MALEPRSRLTCPTGGGRSGAQLAASRWSRSHFSSRASLVAGRLPAGDVEREARALDDRLAAGDYQTALRLVTDLHQRVAGRYGSESVELARVEDRLVAALVKNGRGGTADALKIAEHALAVKEAALGRDDVDTRPDRAQPGADSTGSGRVQRRTGLAHARARDPAQVAGRRRERCGQPRPRGALPHSAETLRRGREAPRRSAAHPRSACGSRRLSRLRRRSSSSA